MIISDLEFELEMQVGLHIHPVEYFCSVWVEGVYGSFAVWGEVLANPLLPKGGFRSPPRFSLDTFFHRIFSELPLSIPPEMFCAQCDV